MGRSAPSAWTWVFQSNNTHLPCSDSACSRHPLAYRERRQWKDWHQYPISLGLHGFWKQVNPLSNGLPIKSGSQGVYVPIGQLKYLSLPKIVFLILINWHCDWNIPFSVSFINGSLSLRDGSFLRILARWCLKLHSLKYSRPWIHSSFQNANNNSLSLYAAWLVGNPIISPSIS